MRRSPFALAAASLLFFTAVGPTQARAQEHSTIRNPGDHPRYVLEAEPHLIAGFAGQLKDQLTGQGMEAAITKFANFEHLEAKGSAGEVA